ncbi:DUF2507 domain-containing protein [Caldalkalibacillus salinus]|uniref:DUF2507 domain-containing protein n=1 Tax=Caldalkalibacillus salinus TaxID=2803787 RepID=UPI001923AFA9|nr:DUF2507 domain-containing protein [Caldalkalibacillus salinus]
MISEKKAHSASADTKFLKMKGQAVPLYGYHILREHVMKEITGEHQSAILYWAGKNLAEHLRIHTFEQCRDLFLEMGWGYLEKVHSSSHIYRYTLESPFFASRQVDQNQSTFALECGFLTEAIAQIENKQTEGEFKAFISQENQGVQFTIYLQEKGES